MPTLTKAENEIKAIIFRNQVDATKLVGELLQTKGETLCGNDLETLAQYLTVIAAVKQKIESFSQSEGA